MTSTETRTVQDELRTIAKYSLGAGKPLSAAVIIKAADRLDALEKALGEIAEMHCGDQPASSGHSDEVWLRLHIGKMRANARAALSPPSDNSDAQAGAMR